MDDQRTNRDGGGDLSERLEELNLGFRPELAVPGPILMAADDQAIFSFNVSRPNGTRAIIRVPWMYRLRFGGPPGEELGFAFVEVHNSKWLKEVFAEAPYLRDRGLRHFRVAFHDSSMEFLAPEFEHELQPLKSSEKRLAEMTDWVNESHANHPSKRSFPTD